MIHVTCECGKQLHAPDEFAGRQTRCPACKKPVTLPGPQAAIQTTPAPQPMPAAAPEQVPSAAMYEIPNEPARTSGKALWSLILGIVSFACIPLLPAIPAIILGYLGIREVNRNPQTIRGKGMAIAGLILGLLSTLSTCAVGALFAAIVFVGQSAAETSSSNNLKTFGIAMHNYHDAFGNLPSEIPDSKNALVPAGSKLSWRVQLLPFFEQQDVYSQFHQDEPWDSPHNIKLLPLMPKMYLDPRFQTEADREKGVTYYRGFVGSGSILGAAPPADLMSITNANGASNTLMVVEAGEPIPWTKPEDPSFNENSGFGGPGHKDFFALFADGHVQKLKAKTPSSLIGKIINWKNTDPVTIP